MKMKKRMIGDYEPGEKGESFDEISQRIWRNKRRMTPQIPSNPKSVNPIYKMLGMEINLDTKK